MHFETWGDGDPLGTEVHAFGGDTAVVVGIVGDVRHNGIVGDVKDRYYRPHSQIRGALGTTRSMTLTVAAEGSARSLLEPVRREVRALDPSMPINEVATMDEVLSATVAQPRFAMTLLDLSLDPPISGGELAGGATRQGIGALRTITGMGTPDVDDPFAASTQPDDSPIQTVDRG